MDPFGGGYGMQGGMQGMQGGGMQQGQDQMMMSMSMLCICCCVVAVVAYFLLSGSKGSAPPPVVVMETDTPEVEITLMPTTGPDATADPAATHAPTSSSCAASFNSALLGQVNPAFDADKCRNEVLAHNCVEYKSVDILGKYQWRRQKNVPGCTPGTVYTSNNKFAVFNRMKSTFPVFNTDAQVNTALQLISMSRYQATDWERSIGVQNTMWDTLVRTVMNPVAQHTKTLEKAWGAPASPLTIAFLMDTAWAGDGQRLNKIMTHTRLKPRRNQSELAWLTTMIELRHQQFAFGSVNMWRHVSKDQANFFLHSVPVGTFKTIAK